MAASARCHRFVTDEPDIPFTLPVLYEDERIIVVDKPHFLASMPRGMWYRQTVLMRARQQFGEQVTLAHRLDRLTAGVLVLVRDPQFRGAYQTLFEQRRTTKIYECLAPLKPARRPPTGTVRALEPPRSFPLERRSRIVKMRGVLQAREQRGQVNAVTLIEREELAPGITVADGRAVARYRLHPCTGKTHQLRVHMNSLGLPMLNDPWYPRVLDVPYDDFSRPLALVARELQFVDPVSGETKMFISEQPLLANRT
ncbi:pseudouridine synthase [Bifidobacterium gallicum]|uniref:RNA pseudouridylate synthase n=1 Tax=Bifidobacterium gallicum DSM 20093 = LMG 11596 TaxID=561180 RepID=A0A087ALB5_9BIFI|nr:pseudouridine synthase [Bifidobacterium gallicum]KFI59565.1 23S rRNA pseudouridylate synthase [Bifidobacterium gallicum DSM 20093 = LMG 11596]